MDKTLSILIPARNEMFLARTVEDILTNMRGDTEIIVGLDGEWADPGLPMHPRVTVVYYPESIGQRAMTNRLALLSKAKYVMKLDAHCAVDEGFDVKLMEDMQDDWTVIPIMRNLHVFDWLCPDGHRGYQGGKGPCKWRQKEGDKEVGPECGKPTVMDIVWIPKRSPQSTAFRFDKTLKFQYWGEHKARQGEFFGETLSIQGSCFMLTREKYWELDICDETWGSWGHQGSEVALKTWLSGGKVICSKKTWYAHLFRTQDGFKFPYHNPESKIEMARQKCRDLFLNDKWPKAIHTLDWLLKRFAPVPEWHDKV